MKNTRARAVLLAAVFVVAGLAKVHGLVPSRVMDYDGDTKADYVMVRNTGGGPTGQITWFANGLVNTSVTPWGIATDFFVAGDFDGDGKNDVTVWRPGPPGSAYFFTRRSSDNGLTMVQFGQTGDDPTVVRDYDGDGKTDYAVYRGGAAAGDPSFWWYRKSTDLSINVVPWGQNGDFVSPGDYDGDGKADFVIQRNNGGGQARFFMNLTTAGFTSLVFGTPTDVIVPGDYDGDGKTDIATIRGIGGQIVWFYLPSGGCGGCAYRATTFGLSGSDFVTQADYDGDGRTDVAVWRPNADPNANFFYVLNSNAIGDPFISAFEWGQNGDYPVANWDTH